MAGIVEASKHIGRVWIVTGTVVVLAVGVAFTVVGYAQADFNVAHLCFLISAGAIMTATVFSLVWSSWPTSLRVLAAAVVFAIVGVILVESLRWVARRKELVKEATELAPQVSSPSTVITTTDALTQEQSTTHRDERQSLRPLVRDDLFAVTIPFNRGKAQSVVPQYLGPATFSGGDFKDHLYTDLGWLSTTALIGDDQSIGGEELANALNSAKPTTADAQSVLLAEVLQCYIIEQIDILQRDSFGVKTTVGEGPEAILGKGIHAPDRVRLPGSQFMTAFAVSRLSRSSRIKMTLGTIGFWAPKSSELFIENQASGSGKPLLYVFTMRRRGTYELTVTIEESLRATSGLPKGFRASADVNPADVIPYVFAVRCHFEFQRSATMDGMEQEEYTKWAESLFAGLKQKLALQSSAPSGAS